MTVILKGNVEWIFVMIDPLKLWKVHFLKLFCQYFKNVCLYDLMNKMQ